MASPRTRRLKIDYEQLSRRSTNWPVIQVSASAGLPPNTTLCLLTQGIVCGTASAGKFWSGLWHVLEVEPIARLSAPCAAIRLYMLTPVFHPTLTIPPCVLAIFGRRPRDSTTLSYT